MNKIIRVFIIGILTFSLQACTNSALLQLSYSEKPVIIRANREHKVATAISFPLNLTIRNKYIREKGYGEIDYYYGFIEKGIGVDLYENNQKISNNGLKIIKGNTRKNYLLYTRHHTDFTEFTQQQLKPYVTKMLELNQDTLHVGTVAEFRERHSELFKMLTEDDTISIRYLKGKNSGLGERIAIPANFVCYCK